MRIPVRIVGDDEKGEAIFHYSMGSFAGRDTALALGGGRPHHPALSYPAGALSAPRATGGGSACRQRLRPAEGPVGQALGGRLARQRPSPRANTRLGQKGQNLPDGCKTLFKRPIFVLATGAGSSEPYGRCAACLHSGRLSHLPRGAHPYPPTWVERKMGSVICSIWSAAPRCHRCAGPRPGGCLRASVGWRSPWPPAWLMAAL